MSDGCRPRAKTFSRFRGSGGAAGIRATLRVGKCGDTICIGVADCLGSHLGLKLRSDEALRCLRRHLRAHRPVWNLGDRGLAVMLGGMREVEATLRAATEELARIAGRPLTPKLVCVALGITAQERLRWTRDGRLPSSGRIGVKRGQVLHLPTYSVNAIARLAATPEVVAAWRERDAQTDL